MKIYVKGGYHLKSENIWTLVIKFIEGNKILPGEKLVELNNPQSSFTVKSLIIGRASIGSDLFDILIEDPGTDISNLENKIFTKV
jgi:hypothetical protein